MINRITVNPTICHGQAVITGTRIPVAQLVGMLAGGDSIDELLQEYPTIQKEDVLAALQYVAQLAQEQIAPLDYLSS